MGLAAAAVCVAIGDGDAIWVGEEIWSGVLVANCVCVTVEVSVLSTVDAVVGVCVGIALGVGLPAGSDGHPFRAASTAFD